MSNKFNTGDVVCLMKDSAIYKRTVAHVNEATATVDGVEYKHWSGHRNTRDAQNNSTIWHWRDIDTARLELQELGIYSANYKEAK